MKKKTIKLKSTTWKPIRRGAIYCSPGCGGGCTFVDYTWALSRAIKIARRLGPGWKPQVRENLGWWGQVISDCGRIEICINQESYTAYFGEARAKGRRWAGVRWAEHAPTPEQALAKVIKAAIKDLKEIEGILGDIPCQHHQWCLQKAKKIKIIK